MRRTWVSLAVLGLLAAPAGATDARYSRGKSEWLARSYPPAQTTLLDYRRAGYGRTAEVDYMLGTSGCRIDEQRAWGARVLGSVLYRYPLTQSSRALVIREHDLCRSAMAMPQLDATTARTQLAVAAGAMARGKMYYLANGDQPVATYAARPLGPIDPAAMAGRVVPLEIDGVSQAPAIKAALTAVAPMGAKVFVTGRFAFVSTARHTDAQLLAMAKRLETYLAFLETRFGLTLPANYLTLWLVSSQNDLRSAARKLHNLDVSPATIGYTFQDDQSAVALIPGTVIGTLFHELFHLVVRSRFGDIPQWLDEGMAALYEVSEIEGAEVRGLRNWRGPVLAKYWAQRPLLANLITAPWLVNDTPGERIEYDGPPLSTETITALFATARYFALYLQDKGKLQPVFERLLALQPGDADNPAAAAIGAVMDELGPIDKVQADFDRWFLAQEKLPPPPATTNTVSKFEPGKTCDPDPLATERRQAQQQQQQQQQNILPPCPGVEGTEKAQ